MAVGSVLLKRQTSVWVKSEQGRLGLSALVFSREVRKAGMPEAGAVGVALGDGEIA
jgi:hypothetical protein